MRGIGVLACVVLIGCQQASLAPSPSSAGVPDGSASVPAFERQEPSTPPVANTAAEADAPAAPDDAAATPTAVATAEPEAPPAPLPDVEVRNVGMHIGGEDNTADQKRPIRAAISKHNDDMRRCYAKADDPPNKTTFGVDIRISGKGGTPKVSNPRHGMRGEGVTDCMLAVFSSVDFPKQPGGRARMVSYSVQFKKKN